MHIGLAKASPCASPPPSLKFHPPPWRCCKPVERNGTWHMQWRSHRMRGPHAHAPAWHSPPTTLLGPVETTTPLARMRSLPGFAPAPFHLRGRTAARQLQAAYRLLGPRAARAGYRSGTVPESGWRCATLAPVRRPVEERVISGMLRASGRVGAKGCCLGPRDGESVAECAAKLGNL